MKKTKESKNEFETISKILDILCSLRLGQEGIEGIGIDYEVLGLTVLCQYRHQGGELQNIVYQHGMPAITIAEGQPK